jgi:1-acyl-sn-glycerol-3-phosphate acyltransferase
VGGKIPIPRRPIPHAVGPVEAVLGAVRIGAALLLAGVGAAAVVLAALVPGRVRGARPAAWAAVGLARAFLALFAVRVEAPPAAAIRGHRGLVFINHVSYLDPVVVMVRGPVRFLAASGVRKLPFVGAIAMAIGTVFVDRSDRTSRAASRARIREELLARPSSPVTIAPEGQIGPGGGTVFPFRRGAFEIAVETGLPILPLVLAYAPFDAVVWQQREPLLVALWRLGARTGGVRATATPLPLVRPAPAATEEEEDAEAERLATATEAAYVAALRA